MSKTTRGLFYQIAKFLGDVNAVKEGKVGKRIARWTAATVTERGDCGNFFK